MVEEKWPQYITGEMPRNQFQIIWSQISPINFTRSHWKYHLKIHHCFFSFFDWRLNRHVKVKFAGSISGIFWTSVYFKKLICRILDVRLAVFIQRNLSSRRLVFVLFSRKKSLRPLKIFEKSDGPLIFSKKVFVDGPGPSTHKFWPVLKLSRSSLLEEWVFSPIIHFYTRLSNLSSGPLRWLARLLFVV